MQYTSGDCKASGKSWSSAQIPHPPYAPRQGSDPGLRALCASGKHKKMATTNYTAFETDKLYGI